MIQISALDAAPRAIRQRFAAAAVDLGCVRRFPLVIHFSSTEEQPNRKTANSLCARILLEAYYAGFRRRQ
jgi:hypothetical protein